MEFLSILTLLGCTTLFHNGFSPIFSVMKELRRPDSMHRAPVYLFFGIKLLFDAVTGVLPVTLWQYPCYYVAWIIAEKSSLLSATAFYLCSNSVCWMQMSDTFLCTNPSWAVYSSDFAGWVTCLTVGLPYYLNSLVATLLFSFLFKVIRERVQLYAPSYNLGVL